MQDLQHLLSQYLRDCQYQKGLDPKTIKAYRIDLAQFSVLMGQSSSGLTREGIMEYISNLHQHYKPKTIRRKIASVKAFCGYLEYEEVDIRYIQQLLGHSSIVTTQIYTHVAGKKQRDILSEKHPRNKIHSM